MTSKSKQEVQEDLKGEITENDCFESRIEALLVSILRELKRIK